MNIIPEELVTETYKEVGQFEAEQAHSEMTRMGKIQPNLIAFMLEFTQDSGPEVAELGIYLMFVVFRMYEKSIKKPLKQVSFETLAECYESKQTLVEKLEDTHDRFIERIASNQVLDQPHVIKYILEALFEDAQEDDDLGLTEEDTGYLFLLLTTVVDALNKTFDESGL